MLKIQSCKGCTNRHVGCHGTCETYKAERKALDADKLVAKTNKDKYEAYSDYKVKVVKKTKAAYNIP